MTSKASFPILPPVQTPEPYEPGPAAERRSDPSAPIPRPAAPLTGFGAHLAWIAALVLAVSAFTGWYTGSGEGPTVAVIVAGLLRASDEL